ncbi:hypothetical protein [Zooshikella ganghwensis]|uniref:Spermidine synthase n=1 Tax=Zooshikella ganghwensis TaxID=202772 RepID=A0A4P9VRY8_9GAMM|nr:hypothetical protein [Zooshikella ganghwensis]RDH45407.1 spermidine synthase [Zooshikella ganghwensis]
MENVDSTTLPKQDIILKYILLLAFFISGFSGLIYESIWTHYLKLFLGHSAYAQTLVLSIFMGGMALGAWLASKYLHKVNNYFLAYAIIEAIIGVAALSFHTVYVLITDFSYNTAFQWFESEASIELYKWILSSILILPQTVLLGSTFPLMSTGFVQRFPKSKGYSLSILYFSNSFGAAIGVLISGFVLINLVGLPGTLLTAGLLNFLVALLSWAVSKMLVTESIEPPHLSSNESTSHHLLKIMLIVAAFTGAASFMYEIAWVRMLSMVLGSSVHSFELMLSAFILGLAIGGFWIRNKLHKLKNPIKTLANIQIIMGLLSASTIVFYNQIFDLMAFTLQALNRTEEGYIYFNLISHSICLFVMLPATICAGMTLPLITYLLLEKGYNSRAIGWVYSANTVGSIIGIIFASQIIMPILGLEHLVVFGSLIDIILGLLILYYFNKVNIAIPVLTLFAPLLVINFFNFDPIRMSSGVFRTGHIPHNEKLEVLFSRHGKTATVAVTQFNKDNKSMAISTNGKPDAGVNSLNSKPSGDEPTMLLTGALPLAFSSNPENVAVIGIGSGLSSQVVLSSDSVKHVDTIEIEPEMVKGAKLFAPRNNLTFNDSRSKIVIGDARTFFHSSSKHYDIIISEPSNPWVSGVASLFTTEFYKLISNSLSNNGIYAQWIHIYEFDIYLLASILSAISHNFEDYMIFSTNYVDLLIISSNNQLNLSNINNIFKHQKIKKELSRIGHFKTDDLLIHYLTNKSQSLFLTKSIKPNSDYFPVVQQKADKYRFLKKSASPIHQLRLSPFFKEEEISFKKINTSQNNSFIYSTHSKASKEFTKNIKSDMIYILSQQKNLCSQENLTNIILNSISTKLNLIYTYTSKQQIEETTNILKPKNCRNPKIDNLLDALMSIHTNKHERVITSINNLKNLGLNSEQLNINLIYSLIKTNKLEEAKKVFYNSGLYKNKVASSFFVNLFHELDTN